MQVASWEEGRPPFRTYSFQPIRRQVESKSTNSCARARTLFLNNLRSFLFLSGRQKVSLYPFGVPHSPPGVCQGFQRYSRYPDTEDGPSLGSGTRLFPGQGMAHQVLPIVLWILPESGLKGISHPVTSSTKSMSVLGKRLTLLLPCRAGAQTSGWDGLLEPRRFSLPGTFSSPEPHPRQSTHSISSPANPPLLLYSPPHVQCCSRQTLAERRRENEVEGGKPEQLPLPTATWVRL